MKFSLKTIAAAVALATVAAGANATMSTAGTAKDGSLVMFAYSASSGYVTGMFDLGLTIDQVIPAAGSINSAFTTGGAGAEIVWNLKSNTVTGSLGSTLGITGNWGTQYNDWMADLNGATDIRYAVFAASKESATDVRALSTTNELSKVATQGKSNLAAFSTVFDNFIAPHNLIGSNATDANGGSSSLDSVSSKAAANNSFGAGMNWLTKASFNATADAGTALSFFYFDTNQVGTVARNIQFADTTFNFNAANGTLSYDVAAAVPEPESYAMFLAGLGLLGAVARRRRAK